MAYVCQDCNLVWTLPKNFCKRCRSRNIKNTSQPFSPAVNRLQADDDGQVKQVLGPVRDEGDESTATV